MEYLMVPNLNQSSVFIRSQPQLTFGSHLNTPHITKPHPQFNASQVQVNFRLHLETATLYGNSITKQIGSTTNRFQFIRQSTWWFQISTRAQFLFNLNHNSLLIRTQTHHILQNLIYSSVRLKYKSIFVCTLKLRHFTDNSITKQIGSTTNRFQFLLWSTWWFQISTRAQFLLDLNHNSLLIRTQTHHILQNVSYTSVRLKYKSIFVYTLKL